MTAKGKGKTGSQKGSAPRPPEPLPLQNRKPLWRTTLDGLIAIVGTGIVGVGLEECRGPVLDGPSGAFDSPFSGSFSLKNPRQFSSLEHVRFTCEEKRIQFAYGSWSRGNKEYFPDLDLRLQAGKNIELSCAQFIRASTPLVYVQIEISATFTTLNFLRESSEIFTWTQETKQWIKGTPYP
jgi:hypothetical protein